MFTSLLELYSEHSSRTPLERFSCEVFCGILKSEPSLLNIFLKQFADIDGEKNFTITTEKTYRNKGNSSRIDIVIENENHLIFIEVKVNSSENNKSQLTEYKNILIKEKEKEKEKSTLLLYLTKYLEIKSPEKYTPIPFKQFLWRDIYALVDQEYKNSPNTLTREFLSYLKSQDMNKAPEFTIEDIAALRRLQKLIHSMDECLQNSRGTFTELFGEPDTKVLEENSIQNTRAEAIYQFIRFNRHAMKKTILKDTRIGVFINFGNTEDTEKTPQIEVQLWMDKTDEQTFERFKKSLSILEKHKPSLNENQWGMGVNFREHLSKFIDDKEQFDKIKSWTNEKLKIFHQYMSESKKEYNIPWDFK